MQTLRQYLIESGVPQPAAAMKALTLMSWLEAKLHESKLSPEELATRVSWCAESHPEALDRFFLDDDPPFERFLDIAKGLGIPLSQLYRQFP